MAGSDLVAPQGPQIIMRLLCRAGRGSPHHAGSSASFSGDSLHPSLSLHALSLGWPSAQARWNLSVSGFRIV